MITYHCLKCGATNLSNQLGHLKDCDPEGYNKAVEIMKQMDEIREEMERSEKRIAIITANMNSIELRTEELKKRRNESK